GVSDAEFFENLYLDFQDDEKIDRFIKDSKTYLFETIEQDGLLIKEGLSDLLAFLQENDIKCVVASSSERSLVEFFLEKSGLSAHFDDLIGGDEVARAKPDPEIFEKAWQKTQGTKEETLILEDSLNGIRAADGADIPVIMVTDLFAPNEEADQKTIAVKDNMREV